MSRHEYDDEPYVVIEQSQGSFGSFLVGIAIGAGVALLLAPDSGIETRRRLRRSARASVEQVWWLAMPSTRPDRECCGCRLCR